jgi:hypothetical protein
MVIGIAGSALFATAFALIFLCQRQRQRAQRQKQELAGLIKISKKLRADDIMQKMPLDLVVQVAKDGRRQDITFHTWDFGGQQVYYVLHHLFITEGVCCLCFNMLEALNDRNQCMEYIAFWLNSTYSHVASKEHCSILLVGTHRDIVSDPQQHRTISDTLLSQFEQCSFWRCVRQPSPPLDDSVDSPVDSLCFFPVDNTSNNDSSGTASVMMTINMLAEQQVQAREEKPLRWLKVLDELQNIQKGDMNYIELGSRQTDFGHTSVLTSQNTDTATKPSLWEVAFMNGVTEPADFDALIDFFNNIGVIKHCHLRSMALNCQDVIILKPQWLVNVFSAVITCYTLDGPVVEESMVEAALATTLSSDMYRFESKAILSARLLRYLWEQKGVISMLETLQHGEEREQWEAKFELLLELLLHFDLIFELKDHDHEDDLPGDEHDPIHSLDRATSSERSVENRRFLVPAMLAETHALSAFPRRGEEVATQLPLHCYFAFKEGGASFDRGSGGLLPAVVFARLQAKCASWAQLTSNIEPRLSRRQAKVTFGAQRFELNLVQEMCMIEVVLRVYSHPVEIISLLQHVLIAKILADAFPSITFDINVRDANSGNYLPLQRVRHELATRRQIELNSTERENTFESFNFRGEMYECAQFAAWLPEERLECNDNHYGSTSHGGLFDFFICAHESDLQFVGKLHDCLRKSTGGKARVMFSSRVAKFLAPGAMPQDHGEWASRDIFAIANSSVFVPIISAASLEQWSFEKRAPTTRFIRWLAVSMALFAFYELFNDGLLALFLSQPQEGQHKKQQAWQMYLCYTTVFSLTVPIFIHTFVIRQLFTKEPHNGKNQAFSQWILEHQMWLPLLFFLGAIRPDVLCGLLTSGAFGWSVFQCPLSMRSSKRLAVAGLTTNVLHDLPQLFVSITLFHHWDRGAHGVKGIPEFAMLLLTAGTTLSSAIALVYSLFSRLSADVLLRVMNHSHAGDVRDEGDVDEMMMEYMTALTQQAEREDDEGRSVLQSSMKLGGGESERLPRLIVPLVIDGIFETGNKVTSTERTPTAVDSILLHPIGDNQISIATLRAHDQIMRRDLDLQNDRGFASDFASGFASASGEAIYTVSGVVDAILGHCAVDEERGITRVFTVQQDRWGRYDAAAEYVVAQLRSIGSSQPSLQGQSMQDRGANMKVRRVMGTPSTLEAGEEEGISAAFRDSHTQYSSKISSINDYSTALLQQHSTHSDITGTETSGINAGAVTSSSSSDGRSIVAGADNVRQLKGQQPSCCEFSSSDSVVPGSVSSAYYSAETTNVESFSFRTATSGSIASI